jgi:hypothetical protein
MAKTAKGKFEVIMAKVHYENIMLLIADEEGNKTVFLDPDSLVGKTIEADMTTKRTRTWLDNIKTIK